MKYLREYILNLMRKSAYRPMTLKELVQHFDIPRRDRESFTDVINELTQRGEIILISQNRYGLPRKMGLKVGRLSVHPDGFGFVAPEEGGEDVFIKTKELNTAMHGDRVVARVEHALRGQRQEGRVIQILERARTQVVGRFERFSAYGYVTPYDPRLTSDIYVPARASLDAETGQMVVAEITSWSSRNRTPEGRVVEVLGSPEDPGVDEAVVARHYRLPAVFSPETREAARGVPQEVRPKDRQGRVDLRDLFTVTIDGETARDFDDAVSLELSSKKTWHLWVHVADVGHYVLPGSPLDRDARERGTSVYFPGTVIPMLPEELSNGICSLNPRVERLAVTVFMEIDRAGHVLRSDFLETVIRSDARLTYGQVRDVVEGREEPPEGLPDDTPLRLRRMAELAEVLRQARLRRGSIDFDLPEAEILLDLRGRITDIIRAERNLAHRLIEEFMLAANRTVAAYMRRMELPFLYRVHDEPEEEKMELFRRFAAGFGYLLPEGRVRPVDLSRLMQEVEGKPEAKAVNNLLLRSMKQAVYSPECTGHFGLAFDDYAQFTSPIRRYPDLVCHRLVKAVIRQGSCPAALQAEMEATLPALAEQCSASERTAMEAEREIVLLKKIRFMKDRVGEEFRGFITGVASFGIFVEPVEVMVEGLVHVSSLGDDYYLFDEETQSLVGQHTRRTFRVGDAVTIRVARVDQERRQIDFQLLADDGAPSRPAARKVRERRSGGRNGTPAPAGGKPRRRSPRKR
jgi:ribonuclease R